MLLRGLSINSGIFNISVKNVSLLYEYWCFIKINSMLKEKYHLIKHDVLRVDKRGMFVTLKKGNSSKISYKNPRNGEEIDLIYNPLSINIPTVSQQPDNILSISKNKSKIRYKYIFDAKYRINPAIEGSKYKQQYIFPGPEEEEDINNMHRYRDALVYENGIRSDYQRTMFGAFVLFPYSDEQEYINHHFYKSIERVNIGGLPFLPNATKLVNNLLDDLINESSESAFERAILPIGIEEKLKEIDFSVRDVMVGTMRSKEQFKIMLENNFYYIPVKYLPDTRFPIRYIALYKSQNIFGNEECGISHYGGVIKYSLIKRNQINEIKTKRDPNALYYRFEINSWKRLENIILPREFGPYVTVFTNMFLLENCEYLPELYISSEEEYRLYFELKRLSSNIEINDDKDVVKGFSFNGCNIVIDDDTIRVYTNNDSYVRYSLKEFKRRPRYIFNDIKRVLGV